MNTFMLNTAYTGLRLNFSKKIRFHNISYLYDLKIFLMCLKADLTL